jgi:hypothetical protein
MAETVSSAPGGHGAHAGETRRDFLYLATAAAGAVGAAAVAWPFIASMNPAADTLALATIDVDLAAIQVGQSITVTWRGKPVFIRHRTAKRVADHLLHTNGVKMNIDAIPLLAISPPEAIDIGPPRQHFINIDFATELAKPLRHFSGNSPFTNHPCARAGLRRGNAWDLHKPTEPGRNCFTSDHCCAPLVLVGGRQNCSRYPLICIQNTSANDHCRLQALSSHAYLATGIV